MLVYRWVHGRLIDCKVSRSCGCKTRSNHHPTTILLVLQTWAVLPCYYYRLPTLSNKPYLFSLFVHNKGKILGYEQWLALLVFFIHSKKVVGSNITVSLSVWSPCTCAWVSTTHLTTSITVAIGMSKCEITPLCWAWIGRVYMASHPMTPVT